MNLLNIIEMDYTNILSGLEWANPIYQNLRLKKQELTNIYIKEIRNEAVYRTVLPTLKYKVSLKK